MKKWIYSLLAACFFLALLPPSAALAASGSLAVKNQEVSIALSLPEEETGETVTALRFQVQVSVSTGSMAQPAFQFADSVPSEVKDVSVSVSESGVYLVDIILSGKKDQVLFTGSGQSSIGTLVLHPSSELFRASVEIAPAVQGGRPVISYVTSSGQSVQTTELLNTTAVTVTDNRAPADNPGSWVVPVYPGTPGTDTPGTDTPGTDTPGTDTPGTDTPGTDTPGTDIPEDTGNFDQTASPKLKVSVKNGERRLAFQWNKITGADGYQLYMYNNKAGKYQRLKTIFDPDKIEYSKYMAYSTSYKFRLRSFKKGADGSRIYGKFSTYVKITTPPSTVKNLTAKQQSAAKVVLTWDAQAGADGYQIFQSTSKNGTYTRIKTIQKGTAGKRSNIAQKKGKKYYYKVRAYTAGADGTRRYGKYSGIKSVTCR